MTLSAEANGSEPPRSRGRRRFQILILVIVALALLWTAGWFGLRQYAASKLGEIEQRIAGEGGSLACGQQSLSGYPFRLGISCMPLAATCPAEGLSVDIAGFEATGLIYNPGHVLMAAKGPATLHGPGDSSLEANWKALQSSVRFGLSGGLKRYSVVTDGLDATLRYPGRVDGPLAARAQHAEFHLLPSADTEDAKDFFLSLTEFYAAFPGRPVLPPFSWSIGATLPDALFAPGVDPVDAWVDSGRPIRIGRMDLGLAGLTARIAGELTPAPDGRLSGQLLVRLDALDRLPEVAELLQPGSRDRVARLIGPVSAFLRPVSEDGRNWREATVTIRDGAMSLGFIPLGSLPPLRPAPAAVTLPAPPASADEVAAAPPPPAAGSPAIPDPPPDEEEGPRADAEAAAAAAEALAPPAAPIAIEPARRPRCAAD